MTRRKSRNNIGARRHSRSSVVLTVSKISVVIINDDQKPAIRLSDLLVLELISYRVHINQSNAKRIHQKKYIIKYTVQNITNLIHESRLAQFFNHFLVFRAKGGEGVVYGIVFSRYPKANSFRLIITKFLPVFIKKINYNWIT